MGKFTTTYLRLSAESLRARGLFCLMVLLAGYYAVAQQTPLYAHAYMNRYLYNPAMAGFEEQSSAYFLYRKQWVGVDGAPETQVFTLDGNLKSQPVGLGVTFLNDITNVLGRTGGAITGSYMVHLTPDQSLRFGLSLLALRNRVFFDRIRAEDVSDPNLLDKVDNRTIFEGSSGVSYNFKKLRVGFSGEQLFQNTFSHNEQAAFKSLNYTLVRHYYTTAEYTFDAGSNFKIRPHLLVRTIQGLRSQFDGNVYVGYKDIIWTNLNYRHNIGVGASLGFVLDRQYVFGYAYELPTTDLSIIGSSTHEFILGIKINQSYEGPHPKSTDVSKTKYENSVHLEKMDALAQQHDQVKGKLEKTEGQLQSQNAELQRLKEVVETYKQELSSAMKVLGATQQDSTTSGDRFYVVVGALRLFDNAKSFQRILKREAGLDTRIVQSASKTWYFIYANDTTSLEEALQQVEAIRKSDAMPFIIEEPWVYKAEKE